MFFHTDAEALSNIECRAREKTLDSVLNEIKNMEKEYTDLGNPENADFSRGGQSQNADE